MVFTEPAAEIIFTVQTHIIALGLHVIMPPPPYGKGRLEAMLQSVLLMALFSDSIPFTAWQYVHFAVSHTFIWEQQYAWSNTISGGHLTSTCDTCFTLYCIMCKFIVVTI